MLSPPATSVPAQGHSQFKTESILKLVDDLTFYPDGDPISGCLLVLLYGSNSGAGKL